MTTRRNRTNPLAATSLWLAVMLVLMLAAPAARARPVADFTFSPESPLTNEPVTFTSLATGASAQSWDLDDDNSCDDAMGAVTQWSYAIARVYEVTLCVSDELGQQGWQKLNVPVRNRSPVAAFTYAPAAPFTDDSIFLTSISADPDGPIASLSWDLDGDGAFDDGSGPTAAVSFPAAGDYPLRLLVTDRDGASTIAAATVTVRERPPEPISPFPLVRMLAAVGQRGTTIRELLVKVPAGARARIRCRGRGCPFRSMVKKPQARERILRIHRFRKQRLRPGAVIEIRVTKRGEVGKYTRFVIRKGRPPMRTDRCLPPGANRPMRCR